MSSVNTGKAQIVPPGATLERIAQAVNDAIKGRSNAVGTVTLTNGATSTTVTAPNCGQGNAVFLFAATLQAAQMSGSATPPYIAEADVDLGQFIVTHTNPGNTTTTYYFVCLG